MSEAQIPQGTMKMLLEEASAVFTAEMHSPLPKRLEAAITHAFNHALEEGIVELGDDPRRSEMVLAPTTWVILAHEVANNSTPEAARELAQKVLDGKR